MVTTRLKNVFDIESFIQEIQTVKQVFMNRDTDSIDFFILFKLIYIYIYLKDLSNKYFVRTTSKLRYFVREWWSPIYIYKKICLDLFIQNRAALVYMLFISLLQV